MEIVTLLANIFVLFAVLGILSAFIHFNYLGWAIFVTAIIVTGAAYVYESNPLLWVYHNPVQSVIYLTLYGAIGVLWSFFKWDRYIKSRAETLLDLWNSGTDGRKDTRGMTWRQYFDEHIPTALNSKWMITGWVVYWPASALAYLLCDLMADLVEWIIKRFGRIYARITERHFKEQA